MLEHRKDAKDVKEKPGIKGRKGHYQIRLGPACSDYRVVKCFLLQSMLHRALGRQPQDVQDSITAEVFEKFWPLTLDDEHLWTGIFAMMFGPVDPWHYRKALVSAYAVCLALQDPFSLQRGLEKMAGELFRTRMDKSGVKELIFRTRVFLLRYHEYKGFFRDAAELALDARSDML
jgi:hypothetical protein